MRNVQVAFSHAKHTAGQLKSKGWPLLRARRSLRKTDEQPDSSGGVACAGAGPGGVCLAISVEQQSCRVSKELLGAKRKPRRAIRIAAEYRGELG